MTSLLPEIRQSVLEPNESLPLPKRKIFGDVDVHNFFESQAFARITLMALRLDEAVTNKTCDENCFESETTLRLVAILNDLESWIDEIPPSKTPQRFGNRAFKDWGARLEEHSHQLHTDLLPIELINILPELLHHFNSSFGSFARLDFGTGHELSFLAYLTILRMVGLLKVEDEQAMVTRIFVAYLSVCRKLQAVYNLEPAGSKGVWGLDDHFFLNYYWGSRQLLKSSFRPSIILEPDRMKPLSSSYLFFSSVLHVRSLKRGPFHEHSPVLQSIASVPNWEKVNSGLLKMWKNEVLGKWPVVQHFYFGSLLNWKHFKTGEELPSTVPVEETGTENGNNFAEIKAPWATGGDGGTQAAWATIPIPLDPTGELKGPLDFPNYSNSVSPRRGPVVIDSNARRMAGS